VGHTAQNINILPTSIPSLSPSTGTALRQRIGASLAQIKRCQRGEHVMQTVQRPPGYRSGAVSLLVILWPTDSRQRQRQGSTALQLWEEEMSEDAVPTARRRGAAIESGQCYNSRQPPQHRAQQTLPPSEGSTVQV